ncbi:MAG: ABC transporter permease subunit [Chloroflexota bacterium]
MTAALVRKLPWRQTDAYRFLTNIPFVIGTLGILVIAFIALFGPQLAPADPQAQRVIIFYPDASFAAPPTPPDQYNLLGTDPIGRDQLSRLLWGARLTLTVVLLGLLGRGALAVTLGVLAGWRRGSWVDHAVGYVTNAVSGLPQLMLALLLVIALQQMGQGITGFVLALALVGWAELAQFVRAEVVRVVATPHVEAARTLGATGAHVVRVHVLRDLAPQLLGLLALEAGSVLLLLAELGFIGFFIAGGVFYVSDSGAPILPVRDRAPEWGQMLAGARNYAFDHQYVAFVPGVVVVSAVLAFNLFAEGLRTASDPFSRNRLSPRTLGAMARTLAAGGLIAAVAFAYVANSSTHISYDEGLRRAREAADRVLPGSAQIAGIVRFTSSAHALSRPDRLTYYFRSPEPFSRILRVTFIDADANALDVKLDANEDELLISSLRPLDGPVAPWDQALASAEELYGGTFRNQTASYMVRVVLAHDVDAEKPFYRIQYGREVGGIQRELRIDARTGSTALAPEEILPTAASHARVALGGQPRLVEVGASWQSTGPNRVRAYGTERPARYRFTFVRGDISDPLTVSVSMEAGHETIASVTRGRPFAFQRDSRTLPIPPLALDDLVGAFDRVLAEGLGDRISMATADRYAVWEITARSVLIEDRWMVEVSLSGQRTPARTDLLAMFRYDLADGMVSELPVPAPRP